MSSFLAGGSLLGTALQIAGQNQARGAEISANNANASFFREQAEFAEFAKQKNIKRFKRESDIFFGDNISRFAKAGVSLTGSPLVSLAADKVLAAEEVDNIVREGNFNVRLAKFRAGQSDASSKALRDAAPYQTAGSILTGIGAAGRAGA